jgi:hypothetical protein
MLIAFGAVQRLLDPLGMKKQYGNAWARVLVHRHSFGSRKCWSQSPVTKNRGNQEALGYGEMFNPPSYNWHQVYRTRPSK